MTIGGVDYRNQLWVEMTARGGTRSDVNLVVPNDYAGIYNVTAGGSVYRRYVGEPRFVQILVNGSTPTNCFVPRSLFYDTQMYVDLQDVTSAIQVRGQTQYARMKGYQNSTGSRNSDVIQMAFVFDGLTSAERVLVRDALLRNATGVANRTLLSWTSSDWSGRNSPYLVGLPDEAIQTIATNVPSNSQSHPTTPD